ncbi:MAG: DUF1566 domain-containing protein [Pseudomonadota bacterium]
MRKFMICSAVTVCLNLTAWFTTFVSSGSASTPSPRFLLHEGEVFDQKTKLTWKRCTAGTTWKKGVGCVGSPKLMRLEDAVQLAQNFGNGWRVPTIEELWSIVDQEHTNPAIDSKVFPDVKNVDEGAPYWSVTRMKEMPSLLYYIDFFDGLVDGHSEGFLMRVRLVHGNE